MGWATVDAYLVGFDCGDVLILVDVVTRSFQPLGEGTRADAVAHRRHVDDLSFCAAKSAACGNPTKLCVPDENMRTDTLR